MSKTTHHTFETPKQLHAWLQANHASEAELWVRIYKKATGQPTVTWDDGVVAAIRHGHPVPAGSGDDMRALSAALAMAESIRTGGIVQRARF